MEPLRILVVDDNEVHGTGLAELLALRGYETVFASTGEQALHVAFTQTLDAVLLDIHLPDMSGYEVCRRLREHPQTSNLAVIFHSGSQGAPPLMGDAFLTYPVEFNVLYSVIQGSVARRRSTLMS
jgi:CheY-like chemotaxis protein